MAIINPFSNNYHSVSDFKGIETSAPWKTRLLKVGIIALSVLAGLLLILPGVAVFRTLVGRFKKMDVASLPSENAAKKTNNLAKPRLEKRHEQRLEEAVIKLQAIRRGTVAKRELSQLKEANNIQKIKEKVELERLISEITSLQHDNLHYRRYSELLLEFIQTQKSFLYMHGVELEFSEGDSVNGFIDEKLSSELRETPLHDLIEIKQNLVSENAQLVERKLGFLKTLESIDSQISAINNSLLVEPSQKVEVIQSKMDDSLWSSESSPRDDQQSLENFDSILTMNPEEIAEIEKNELSSSLITLENEGVSLEDWNTMLLDQTILARDELLTYELHTDGRECTGLNEVLSEENWIDLLDANDLSYAAAKTHSSNKKALVDKRFNLISEKLNKKGWSDFSILFGATGVDNCDQDASCLLMVNKERNLIYVAFHGSRNGSKIPWLFGYGGDWGANYDMKLVNAKDHGLYGAPEDVFFHRGFGKNFVSVQEALLSKLKVFVEGFDSPPQVIITGHSKGGAEASIAVPVIKSFLSDQDLGDTKVGAVTLSAPRAFNLAGANWVRDQVQVRNILRVKVPGDPVTLTPPTNMGYEHVGVPLLDDANTVNERTDKFHNGVKASRTEKWVANYHLGAYRDGGYCFVPEIVMTHGELMEAFKRGVVDRTAKGKSPYPDGYHLYV